LTTNLDVNDELPQQPNLDGAALHGKGALPTDHALYQGVCEHDAHGMAGAVRQGRGTARQA
jgi:hypothetical protein